MARTVEDCAILLQAMAGYDPLDPMSADVPVPDYRAALAGGVRGLRIGLPRRYFFEECDAEIVASAEDAARELERAGAILSEVDVPDAELALLHNGVILRAEAAAFHKERLADEAQRKAFDPGVLARIEAGVLLPATDYAEAARFGREFRRWLGRDLFAAVDVLLHPTTTAVAPPIEGVGAARWLVRNTHPWNVAHVPVLALPCGFSSEGLPIGMSLVGRTWDEATVLRAGHTYQQRTDWHRRTPPI
jgi:aspartyl-tRNA(Asn)/glutamyl-tRNA(Gln) amidotransferase subunit A